MKIVVIGAMNDSGQNAINPNQSYWLFIIFSFIQRYSFHVLISFCIICHHFIVLCRLLLTV